MESSIEELPIGGHGEGGGGGGGGGPINGRSPSSSSSSSSSLVLLGTGCSNGVPNARCLIEPSDPPCEVCSLSLSIPPERNPNYRCNTSLLIDYCHDDGTHNYILIDVGKTFREQVLRWFTRYKIPRVDSIILTHEHADAVLGLDDVRGVQSKSRTNDIKSTPVNLTQFAMDSLAKRFHYLFKRKLKDGEQARYVAQLDWRIIESDCQKPFTSSLLEFVPLPVMHGEDYVCLGFLFGRKARVAYVSDVSRFPTTTEYVISKSGAGQVDLLILDCNSPNKARSDSTHFSIDQSLDAVKRICPKRALFIGMSHCFDHDKYNTILAEWSSREGIQVQLAYDGLRIYTDL